MNWKGINSFLVLLKKQNFLTLSQDISIPLQQSGLISFYSLLSDLEIVTLNDYEHLMTIGGALFWSRLLQNCLVNNLTRIDSSCLQAIHFNPHELFSMAFELLKEETHEEVIKRKGEEAEFTLNIDEKAKCKIKGCPKGVEEIFVGLIKMIQKQKVCIKIGVKVGLEGRNLNSNLKAEFTFVESKEKERGEGESLAKLIEEKIKIKKFEWKLLNGIRFEDLKGHLLPLLMQAMDSKFSISCEEERSKKITILTLRKSILIYIPIIVWK